MAEPGLIQKTYDMVLVCICTRENTSFVICLLCLYNYYAIYLRKNCPLLVTVIISRTMSVSGAKNTFCSPWFLLNRLIQCTRQSTDGSSGGHVSESVCTVTPTKVRVYTKRMVEHTGTTVIIITAHRFFRSRRKFFHINTRNFCKFPLMAATNKKR